MIYGFALSYNHPRDQKYLDTSLRLARKFIANLDADGVPVWVFKLSPGEFPLRDSSAASNAVCGLQEFYGFRIAKKARRCLHSGMTPNESDPKSGDINPSESEAKERINNSVAVTVAVLAAFMAITKVTDDNVCQAMERAKADEVNAWSYYQSKSIKQNLAELGRAQLAGLARTTSGDARVQIESQVTRYDAEIARYETEKAEIKAKAEQHGNSYAALNFRDDQFDLSDATLSIALGTLAVTALTGKRWLLVASWSVGGFGALLGVAGLARLGIHAGWLVKLLS